MNPYTQYYTGNPQAALGAQMLSDPASVNPMPINSQASGSLFGLDPATLKKLYQQNQMGTGLLDKLDSMYGSSTSSVPVTNAQNQWMHAQFANAGLS